MFQDWFEQMWCDAERASEAGDATASQVLETRLYDACLACGTDLGMTQDQIADAMEAGDERVWSELQARMTAASVAA